MTAHRKLHATLTAFRIGDTAGQYPVYGGDGSARHPGRWNTTGQRMIYTSEHYSTALLEKLVRLGEMPPDQHYLRIVIPAGVSYEELNPDKLPGWHDANCIVARRFGGQWYSQRRSAVLIVPSVIAREDSNILINPEHAEFHRINPGRERPILWDDRLFA